MIDIRLGNHHNRNMNDSIELVEAIKEFPGSCDTVWFATEYGYPDLSVHRKSGENIKNIAKIYRDAGIKVSLQVSNTVGHGEYMRSRDHSARDTYNFERVVNENGEASDYRF